MSKIEWTDVTWNPVVGCSRVSEGCRNCYAERDPPKVLRKLKASAKSEAALAAVAAYETAVNGERWSNRVGLMYHKLSEPLRWRRPRMVFVNSMSDLFHPRVPYEFLDKVFAVMALCPQHKFQVLTKRPERMAEYLNDYHPDWDMAWPSEDIDVDVSEIFQERRDVTGEYYIQVRHWPLPNVWLGTSIEDQATANERIPHLLRCPAAVRFLSLEPLLGEVDLAPWLPSELFACLTCEGRRLMATKQEKITPKNVTKTTATYCARSEAQ